MRTIWQGNRIVMVLCGVLACSSTGTGSRLKPRVAPIDSATVSANGTQLYYESAGRGPVVVLIHSGNLDHRMWDPQFETLSREHRVIRYDARGYGKSARPDAPFRADQDLRGLLDALRIDHASLVGISMGGRIAIDFALSYPARVDRLVLAAPGLSGAGIRGDTSWFAAGRIAYSRGDSAGIALAWLTQPFNRPAMEQPAVAARLREIASEQGRYWMTILRNNRSDFDQEGNPPAFGRTKEISAPTLVIFGTRDSPELGAIVDTLVATVPNIRRATIEGSGHLSNMDRPEEFTRLVRGFLRP
jgi:3-oxoadipate enol-lactonase